MVKLVITADIHGLYSGWQKIREQLVPADVLAVAGDLFGTRFAKPDDPDYRPEKIREEYIALKNEKHCIYGNCDIRDFYPGLLFQEKFKFAGKKILLIHGDEEFNDKDFDLIIFGHTHVPFLKAVAGRIHLNPGSPTKPRGFIGKELLGSYAVLENDQIKIINIKNGKIVQELDLSA